MQQIPTPTPIPSVPTPPYGINVDTSEFGTQWAYESVQMWNTIPSDYRDGMQMMILFALFFGALIVFLHKIRKKDASDA